MTTTWKITNADCIVSENNLSDIVTTVHWRYVATQTENDKTYVAETYGAAQLDAPASGSFIEFDSITKEQFVEWLELKLDVESMDINLQNQINLQINPVTVTKQLNFDNIPTSGSLPE
jgi:hypothetical protein